MPTLNLIISIGIFVLVVFLVIAFAFPGEEAKRKRRKKRQLDGQSAPDEDVVAQRIEQCILSLRKELEQTKREHLKTLKLLELAKAKSGKLQEKLAKEKEWLEREEGSAAKKNDEIHQLTKALAKAQQELDTEYSRRLALEREVADLTRGLSSAKDEGRELTSQLIAARAQNDRYAKDIAGLNERMAQLKKQSDETSWVAREEFEKLRQELKEKDKEIERISRES